MFQLFVHIIQIYNFLVLFDLHLKKCIDRKRKQTQKYADKHEYSNRRKIIDVADGNNITKYVFALYILHTNK